MRLREWIKNLYLTQPELLTNKRYLRLKPLSISAVSLLLMLLLCRSLFGESKVKADDQNYKTVSAETVARQGQVVFKVGNYEVKHNASGALASNSISNLGADQGQVISRKDRARNEYVIPAGTKINFTLDGDLNSELSQSPVTAQTPEGFKYQGRVLLPAGTKALGKVSQSTDSERIAVQFDQLVLPSGHQISASGTALMLDGSPGVVGNYHSGSVGRFATSVGMSFLSGGAAALETTSANAFGFNQPDVSTRNVVLNGLAKSTLDQGQRMGEAAQNKKGYVTIGSGQNFQIYFEREVDLSGAIE